MDVHDHISPNINSLSWRCQAVLARATTPIRHRWPICMCHPTQLTPLTTDARAHKVHGQLLRIVAKAQVALLGDPELEKRSEFDHCVL